MAIQVSWNTELNIGGKFGRRKGRVQIYLVSLFPLNKIEKRFCFGNMVWAD
jgi:hypothetical protein